jgi:hypothetical protein
MMDQGVRKLGDKPNQRQAEKHRLRSAVSPWYHTVLLQYDAAASSFMRLSFCLCRLRDARWSIIAVFNPKLLSRAEYPSHTQS